MNRRQLLGSIVLTGMGGCVGSTTSSDETTDTQSHATTEATDGRSTPECTLDVPTPTVAETDGGTLRRVELAKVDPEPSEAVEFDVVLSSTVLTTEESVSVRIGFQNQSARTRSFGFGRPPFVQKQSTKRPGWILFGESDDPTRRSADCWYAEDDSDVAYTALDILDVYPLEPCETVTHTFELWSLQPDPCMPTGRFRFAGEFDIDAESSDETYYDWGFEIEITDAE